jgi:hypothetical protein
MRIRQASLALIFAATAAAATLSAQTLAPASSETSPAGSSRIVFTFEHPQLQPSRYTISVDETGAGRFVSQPGPAGDASDGVFPTPVDRAILLDDVLRADLFQYARSHSFFSTHCTTSAQAALAFTGNKTLAYNGTDGSGSCAFVWASDPVLQRIVDQLGAVAFTIEEGRRLRLEVVHDRLGLDAELETLQDAFKEHRAADLPNIADDLHAIADNQQVMDRARKRAQALLAKSESSQKHN